MPHGTPCWCWTLSSFQCARLILHGTLTFMGCAVVWAGFLALQHASPLTRLQPPCTRAFASRPLAFTFRPSPQRVSGGFTTAAGFKRTPDTCNHHLCRTPHTAPAACWQHMPDVFPTLYAGSRPAVATLPLRAWRDGLFNSSVTLPCIRTPRGHTPGHETTRATHAHTPRPTLPPTRLRLRHAAQRAARGGIQGELFDTGVVTWFWVHRPLTRHVPHLARHLALRASLSSFDTTPRTHCLRGPWFSLHRAPRGSSVNWAGHALGPMNYRQWTLAPLPLLGMPGSTPFDGLAMPCRALPGAHQAPSHLPTAPTRAHARCAAPQAPVPPAMPRRSRSPLPRDAGHLARLPSGGTSGFAGMAR